jgi:predicted porin
MKKSLFTLAALSAFAAGAHAQSSVTLFGIADAAVRQVKNGSAGSQKQLASGSNATSRWGLRGVEDLGGGLKAGFHLESQINFDTGTADANKFWGRRATVSLMGNFGEVRMGRDYTPTAYNTFADEFGIVGVGSRGIFSYGAGSNLGSTATTVLRADNTVGYFLPSMGGLYGHLQMAAGEGVNGNKYVGGRLGYETGPINVGFAYGKTETGTTTPDFKNYNIQFNYKFGFATLHTLYDVKEWNPRKSKDLSIGATVPVGPGALKVGYTRQIARAGPPVPVSPTPMTAPAWASGMSTISRSAPRCTRPTARSPTRAPRAAPSSTRRRRACWAARSRPASSSAFATTSDRRIVER